MKEIYTQTRLVIAMLTLLVAVQTQAVERYTWWHTNIQVYPTGAGKVYFEQYTGETTPEADRNYQESITDKTVALRRTSDQAGTYASQTFLGYAKAEGDYTFLGWKKVKDSYWTDLDIEPSIDIRDYFEDGYLSTDAEDGELYLTTYVVSEDNDAEHYSEKPNNTVVAVFGHIAFRYINGQNSSFGTASIEDSETGVGDFTNITATPAEGYEFLYWLDDEGRKYEDATIEVELNRSMTFYPVFISPRHEIIDFGEGGYRLISSPDKDIHYEYDYSGQNTFHSYILADNTYTIITYPTGEYRTEIEEYDEEIETVTEQGYDTVIIEKKEREVQVPIYRTDTTINHRKSFVTNPQYVTDNDSWGHSFSAGDAVLFHGAGLVCIEYQDKSQYSTPLGQNMLKAADAEGTDIALLPQDGMRYYTFDTTTQTFNAATEGIVPAGTGYLALPADHPSAAYDIIYFVSKNAEIPAPSTIAAIVSKADAGNVYDIAGRKVTTPTRGFYIVDGRKVFVK